MNVELGASVTIHGEVPMVVTYVSEGSLSDEIATVEKLGMVEVEPSDLIPNKERFRAFEAVDGFIAFTADQELFKRIVLGTYLSKVRPAMYADIFHDVLRAPFDAKELDMLLELGADDKLTVRIMIIADDRKRRTVQ